MEATQSHAALLAEIDLPQHSRKGTFEAVLELVDELPRGRALDVPCGTGLLAEALRRLGFRVTAADLDGERFGLHGSIPFHHADLDGPLPFPDRSFDLVYCGDGIEHLENAFSAFREFARVLDAEGTLLVATPNYLSLERRLRFLLTGSLTKPLARRPHPARLPKFARGHINPVTLTRMAWMAESAGLELVRSRVLVPAPRQRLLAPLALIVLLARPFLPSSYRRDLFATQTLSKQTLLGGKKILAVFRKPSERVGR